MNYENSYEEKWVVIEASNVGNSVLGRTGKFTIEASKINSEEPVKEVLELALTHGITVREVEAGGMGTLYEVSKNSLIGFFSVELCQFQTNIPVMREVNENEFSYPELEVTETKVVTMKVTAQTAEVILKSINVTGSELAQAIHEEKYLALLVSEEGEYEFATSVEEVERKTSGEGSNGNYELIAVVEEKEGPCQCRYCEEGLEPEYNSEEVISMAVEQFREAIKTWANY